MALANHRMPSARAAGGQRSDKLAEVRGALEGRFLEAGEVLVTATEGIGRLISALDGLHESLDETMVRATTDGLKDSANDLQRLPDAHHGRLEHIAQLLKVQSGLADGVAEMHRNISYLRMLAVNIRIAAAAIPAAREEFATFSEEISACVERAGSAIEALSRDLVELAAELQVARQRHGELAKLCASLLPAIPDALHADAEALIRQQGRIADAVEEAKSLAQEVRRKVAGALTAMQVGDSTRQRIEHVEAGLALGADSARRLAPAERDVFDALFGRLLAALVRAAAEEFSRDAGQLCDSIAGIAQDAKAISGLGEAAAGHGEAGGASAMDNLEHDVERALGLVGEMELSDRVARDMAQKAVAMARTLSTRINGLQTIRQSVQQMALNATLKSNRIGEAAKPLSIISTELREYAGQLEALGARAQVMIEGLVRHSDALAGEETGSGGDETVAAQIDRVIERIRGANRSIESDIANAGEIGAVVIATLADAAVRLDLHGEFGLRLERLAAELAVDDGVAPMPEGQVFEALSDVAMRLSRLYTMAQEREVHRAWAAPLAISETTAAPVVAEAQPDDDMLF